MKLNDARSLFAHTFFEKRSMSISPATLDEVLREGAEAVTRWVERALEEARAGEREARTRLAECVHELDDVRAALEEEEREADAAGLTLSHAMLALKFQAGSGAIERVIDAARSCSLSALDGALDVSLDTARDSPWVRTALDTLDDALRAAAASTSTDSGSSRDQSECLGRLLELGAHPLARDAHGRTALHIAAECERPTALMQLLTWVERGSTVFDVDELDADGATPLHAAAAAGRVAQVEALLESNADFTRRGGPDRKTPVELAPDEATRASLTTGEVFARAASRLAVRLYERDELEGALEIQLVVLDLARHGHARRGEPRRLASAALGVAKLSMDMGRWDAAARLAGEALTASPDLRGALALRGGARLLLFDFRGALADLVALRRVVTNQSGNGVGFGKGSLEALDGIITLARELAARVEDPHLVLGLQSSSTSIDARRAYLAKSLEWHPDKNRDSPEAAARAAQAFVAVADAARVLSCSAAELPKQQPLQQPRLRRGKELDPFDAARVEAAWARAQAGIFECCGGSGGASGRRAGPIGRAVTRSSDSPMSTRSSSSGAAADEDDRENTMPPDASKRLKGTQAGVAASNVGMSGV